MRRRLGAGLGLALGLVAACTTTIHPTSTAKPLAPDAPAFSHRTYDEVLRRYVDDQGLVDYLGLQQNHGDLDRYYARLAATSPDNQPERFPEYSDRLAYWLNAYDAGVLVAVLSQYPIDSVRDVLPPAPLFFLPRLSGFFVFTRIVLGERAISFRALENSVIRERFDDPRIHFALVCASMSCPKLRAHAYASAELEAQLDEDARRFMAEERGVQIDPVARKIRLSKIFEWYQSDFTGWLKRQGAEASLRAYVRRYLDDERRAALDACGDCAVEFMEYDWALNDQRPE
jgi:hypothetical protein